MVDIQMLYTFKKVVHKLEQLELRGNLLDWIESFLIDRQFCVRIYGQVSRNHPAVSGVSQGSVLKPLLFLLYTSDLIKAINTFVPIIQKCIAIRNREIFKQLAVDQTNGCLP